MPVCRPSNKHKQAIWRDKANDSELQLADRLVRFGLPYLEQAFGGPGVRLEVLEQRKPLEPTEELTQDLLMLMRGVLRQAVRLPLASEGSGWGLTH